MCLTGRAGPEFGDIRAARCAKDPFTRSIVERRHRIHRTRAGTARERPSRSTRAGQTFARLEEKTKRISHLVGDSLALRLLASLEARGDGRQLRAAVAGVYIGTLMAMGHAVADMVGCVWWVPARVRSDRWRAGTFEVDTAVDIEIIEVSFARDKTSILSTGTTGKPPRPPPPPACRTSRCTPPPTSPASACAPSPSPPASRAPCRSSRSPPP